MKSFTLKEEIEYLLNNDNDKNFEEVKKNYTYKENYALSIFYSCFSIIPIIFFNCIIDLSMEVSILISFLIFFSCFVSFLTYANDKVNVKNLNLLKSSRKKRELSKI